MHVTSTYVGWGVTGGQLIVVQTSTWLFGKLCLNSLYRLTLSRCLQNELASASAQQPLRLLVPPRCPRLPPTAWRPWRLPPAAVAAAALASATVSATPTPHPLPPPTRSPPTPETPPRNSPKGAHRQWPTPPKAGRLRGDIFAFEDTLAERGGAHF